LSIESQIGTGVNNGYQNVECLFKFITDLDANYKSKITFKEV